MLHRDGVSPQYGSVEPRFQDEEVIMKCVICKTGKTNHGKATVILQREDTVVVVKDVPAQVCENCGEYYLSENISARVLELAENAIKHNAEVEILRFAA